MNTVFGISEKIGINYFFKCFSNKYADFEGRARRREFWWIYFWAHVLALIILWIWSPYLKGSDELEFATALSVTIFAGLISVAPLYAVTIRRFHDVGLSGWWWLLTLIPLVGGVFFLIVALTKGQPKTNSWGPIPSFESETDDEKNFRKSFKTAQSGDRNAQYFIGFCYWRGDGVEKNKLEARYWLEKASQQGDPRATFLLTSLAESDEAEKKLFLLGAEQGDLYSMIDVALDSFFAHEENSDTVKSSQLIANPQNSFLLAKKAAESNYKRAFEAVALFYLEGFGVSKDENEAIKWLQKGVTQNCKDSCRFLGEIYSSDDSKNKDLLASLKYFKKGAELGDAKSQFKYALALSTGNGVSKNETEAYRWFLSANSQDELDSSDHESCVKFIADLESKLSRDEIQKAQLLASQFQAPEKSSSIKIPIPAPPRESLARIIMFFLFPFIVFFLSSLISGFIIVTFNLFPPTNTAPKGDPNVFHKEKAELDAI
jgi:uncharacterized membrane protein YhaH (DUF805 family)